MTRTAALIVSILIAGGARPAAAQGDITTLFTVAPAAQAAQPPQARQPPEPPPPPPRPRRLGSMVGYIDNPLVESKIRIRFDAGFEDTVPDRAEFFYAKCGCYRDPSLGANQDPDAPGPQPGVANDIDFQQLYLDAELAFTPRLSGFVELPFRWLRPQGFIGGGGGFGDQSGLSDIRAGVKLGLANSDAQRVTAQVRFFFPSGDAGKGLGTDHATIEPMLLLLHRLNEVVSVESQIGLWVPFGGSAPVPVTADGHFAGDVLSYGIGPSFTLYTSDSVRFAPVVELVGWHVFNGYQTTENDGNDAGGVDIVNLKFGARTVFREGSVYVGYGLALTDRDWYDKILRIEYRYEF